VNYILEYRAELSFQNRDYENAEKLYLEAKNPEKLIEKYKSIHKFGDAKHVAESYLNSDDQRKITSDWGRKPRERPAIIATRPTLTVDLHLVEDQMSEHKVEYIRVIGYDIVEAQLTFTSTRLIYLSPLQNYIKC
jgi:hypothetical protein